MNRDLAVQKTLSPLTQGRSAAETIQRVEVTPRCLSAPLQMLLRKSLSWPLGDCIEPSVSPPGGLSLRSVSIERFSGTGVIAQLGERFNGIEEVGGSIPPGSTIYCFDFIKFLTVRIVCDVSRI